MDQVEFRLSSPDRQSLIATRATLLATLPAVSCDDIRLGRSGDWVCHGAIDPALLAVTHQPEPPERPAAPPTIDEWISAYRDVRAFWARITNGTSYAVRLLDRAVAELFHERAEQLTDLAATRRDRRNR